jgi:hypothetical protein
MRVRACNSGGDIGALGGLRGLPNSSAFMLEGAQSLRQGARRITVSRFIYTVRANVPDFGNG